MVPSLTFCSSTCGKLSPFNKDIQDELISIDENRSDACHVIFPAIIREKDGQMFYNASVVSFKL